MSSPQKRTADEAGLNPGPKPASLQARTYADVQDVVAAMSKKQARSGRRAAAKAIIADLVAGYFDGDPWQPAATAIKLEKDQQGDGMLCLQGEVPLVCASPPSVFVDLKGLKFTAKIDMEAVDAAKAVLGPLRKAARVLAALQSLNDEDPEEEAVAEAAALVGTHLAALSFMRAERLLGPEALAYALARHATEVVPAKPKKGRDVNPDLRKTLAECIGSGKKDTQAVAKSIAKKIEEDWSRGKTSLFSRVARRTEWTDRDGVTHKQISVEVKMNLLNKSTIKDVDTMNAVFKSCELDTREDGTPSLLATVVHDSKKVYNVPKRCVAFDKVGDRTVLRNVNFFEGLSGGKETDYGEVWKAPAGQYILQNFRASASKHHDRLVRSGFLQVADFWASHGRASADAEEDAYEEEDGVY